MPQNAAYYSVAKNLWRIRRVCRKQKTNKKTKQKHRKEQRKKEKFPMKKERCRSKKVNNNKVLYTRSNAGFLQYSCSFVWRGGGGLIIKPFACFLSNDNVSTNLYPIYEIYFNNFGHAYYRKTRQGM
jgi:hypothetical protein